MSNNMHEKATLYLVNDLWAYDRIEVCNVIWRFEKHAQFPNAARLEYTVRGKRKRQTRIITTSPLVVLDGWDHPLPPPKFDQPKRNSGQGHTIFTTQTTRYLSADPKWHIEFNAFLHEYLERSKARVILDLRKHDPTKPRSDIENQYLCEPVQDVPPGSKLHIWKKPRADHNSSAEGSDWHAKVRLSDRPYYLDLYWRKTANDPAVRVGVFRLDLPGLLREGYIRRESEDSQDSDVRLRFFRANNGIVYVQTKQGKPRLELPNAELEKNTDSALVTDIEEIISNKTANPTIIRALVNARVGQGKFGLEVRKFWNHCCSVTGSSTKAALEASHIKGWAGSTDDERLDPNNGLLLTANLHKLFDAGLISFEDSGKMLVSSKLSQSEREIFNLVGKKLTKAPSLETANYLSHHRTKFLE